MLFKSHTGPAPNGLPLLHDEGGALDHREVAEGARRHQPSTGQVENERKCWPKFILLVTWNVEQ